MANKKVSQLDPLSNIQDDDLVEITKYMGAGLGDGGGDYKSYKMTWANLKSFINYSQVVKIVFTTAGSQEYLVERYERVDSYIRVYGSSPTETIRIYNLTSDQEFLPETDASSGTIGYYTQSTVSTERNLVVSLSAAGTVYLFVTKNLIP